MIDETIYLLLKTAITEKVYSEISPDTEDYPHVIYSVVSSADNYAIDQTGITDTVSRVQIEVKDDNKANGVLIADTLNTLLSGYKGTVNSKAIDLIKRVDRRTISTKTTDTKKTVYRLIQDFIIHH